MSAISASMSLSAVAKAKTVRAPKRTAVKCSAAKPAFVEKVEKAGKAAFGGLAALTLAAGSAQAVTYDEFQGLTYLQVKGTGLANTCSVVDTGGSGSAIKAGDYNLEKFCMEPTSFTVKEESSFKAGESEFVKTKLMTRLTYTLDGMTGSFKVGSDGSVAIQEKDGLDYAAVTVQLPGGERVPFLFTMKEFTGKGNTSQFGGDFVVPSYRGSSFLDPKGRGGSTGYDNAVALPAKSDAEIGRASCRERV